MHSGFYSPHTVMHSGFHTVIIAPSQEPLRTIDGEIQFESFLCVIFHHQRICEELKKETMSVEQIGKACMEAICCLLGWSCHSLILSSFLLSLSTSLSLIAKSSWWKLHWLLNIKPQQVLSMSLSLSHITIINVINQHGWSQYHRQDTVSNTFIGPYSIFRLQGLSERKAKVKWFFWALNFTKSWFSQLSLVEN